MRDNISISRRELAILFAQVLQAAPEYRPQFFSAEEFAALESFAEILIPTDDTPGAREARCAQFIDFYVNASPAETKERWRLAMRDLRKAGLVAASSKDHPAHEAYLLVRQENMFAFFTSKPGTLGFLDYRGNSHNDSFPACTHPEHHRV